MNRTVPSPMSAWQPPACRLNASSFGPQLLVVHGHDAGPPSGFLLPLIQPFGPVAAVASACPETPLPVSASAQRSGQVLSPAAPHIWVVSQPGGMPLTYCVLV